MDDKPEPLEKNQIPTSAISTPLPIRIEQIPGPLQQPSLAPNTTIQDDIVTAGQRRINLIWESTQTFIAALVIVSLLYACLRIIILIAIPDATEQQIALATTAFMILSNLGSLVVGFYFGRTNHQRIGGVGSKDGGR